MVLFYIIIILCTVVYVLLRPITNSIENIVGTIVDFGADLILIVFSTPDQLVSTPTVHFYIIIILCTPVYVLLRPITNTFCVTSSYDGSPRMKQSKFIQDYA